MWRWSTGVAPELSELHKLCPIYALIGDGCGVVSDDEVDSGQWLKQGQIRTTCLFCSLLPNVQVQLWWSLSCLHFVTLRTEASARNAITMAEAVVGALIGKLGAALAKEATTYGAALLYKDTSALKRLFGEICRAERELESMKAYLRESEKFLDTDETMGIFIKTIRELSFRIEDVVDEFMYKLEGSRHGGLAARIKKKIKQVKVWRRLSRQLRDINIELEDTVKRRDRYVTPIMGRHTGSTHHHFASEDTNQASCFAREEELVGIEDDAAKLKGWLVDDLEQRNTKITTVWGMGGVGKTTLVDHVYKSVKLDFDASAWVTVSKSYKVDDLLKKICAEFNVPVDSSIMDMRRLVYSIRRHLEGKRFILVLDDVWEKEVWINNIMPVFPANCTSRFVLTSRLSEVASLSSSNCAIKLKPLQDHHSYILFCKSAFWDNDDKRCPPELSDLATKFLQKCEGLPIAIVCLGRLLSCKPPTYTEWKILFDELELQSVKNTIPVVETILKVSLEDLPYELKNCFLHCALFPENYELKRRRLIRHWITSGFINKKGNKTLERVAEGYLNDLVNRSLLQVVMNNEFGRVKCCRMHDVIRHIAIEKAEKECFGKVYEGNETSLVHRTRRLSIQSTNIELLNLSGAAHLRQIHVFTRFVDIDWLRPILSSSVLLSTLDLQGTEIKVLPNEIFSLFNLRFLGLRNTKIEVLPEAIGRLSNLEVLDAWFTCLLFLPDDVAKLIKLRYLYATVKVTEGSFSRNRGVKMPRGIKNLTGLHALQNVKATSETLCDVAALTELRTFSVNDVTSEHSLILRNALLKMRNLISLSITSMSNANEVLPLEELCLPESLCKLGLAGKLKNKGMSHILSSWLHLNNLTQLYLMSSKLDENSFPTLMVLRSLCLITLDKAYDGHILCFPSQSFPRLKELRVWCAPLLNRVEIEEDALGSLAKLWFVECPELKCLPHGLKYLTFLDELHLVNTAIELIELANVCEEELMKISCIRKFTIISNEENIRQRIVSGEGNELAG